MGSDPDGDSIIYALESYASLGTGSVSGDVLTYTPNDTNGVDSFSYRAYDSENNVSNVASNIITITGNVNNPPTVDNISATSEVQIAITVTLTGSDPEGDSIVFNWTTLQRFC